MATIAQMQRQAQDAQNRGDLAAALKADDAAEQFGMHADERVTCWTCQSWFDHAHNPHTGRRITFAEYRAIQRQRGY